MKHLEDNYRFWRIAVTYVSSIKTQSGELVPLLVLLAIADAVLVYLQPAINNIEPISVGTGHFGLIFTAIIWVPTIVYLALAARVLVRTAGVADMPSNLNWSGIALVWAVTVCLQIALLYITQLVMRIPAAEFLVSVLSLFVYPWSCIAISRIVLGDRMGSSLWGALPFLLQNLWKFVVLAVFISLAGAFLALLVVVLVRGAIGVGSWWKQLVAFLGAFLPAATLPMATLVYLKQVYFPDPPKQERLIPD